VERQARSLAELGAEVHVLVAAGPGRPASRASSVGRLSVSPLSSRRFPVDPRGFDLVHVHSLALAELALELRRRTALPLVYTAHSLVAEELRWGGADAAVARSWGTVQERLLAASDRVVFLSAAERAAAVRLFPALAERSVVVPNGLSPSDPVSSTVTCPAPAGGPVVFAGRFARSKGIELLGDIVAAVLAEPARFGPARFVLAGGHGDATGERVLRDLLRRHPAACAAGGWLSRDRVETLLASAALVLVPSLYEPFGLVALEAMRAGAPVLAADVGGLRDVVTQGSGGRLVGSRDPERWATEVHQILASPETRALLRERGPRHVRAHFDSSRIAGRLLGEVYPAITHGGELTRCA
jgi:glycosyltransferase involved in cell wall biosynthesis